MRRALLVIILLAALPATASAAPLRFQPCAQLPGFQCGTLTVPLDRTGATSGTIGLRVARQADAPKGAGVLVALSGGPGQSSIGAGPFLLQTLRPALRRYRLVLIDQRGTGKSGALRCPRLQATAALDPDWARLTAGCAARLGPARDFYSTTDSVDDLDALRAALGVPRLAFQGTSYGTFVAEQYARRYPAHTDRLVLDSSVRTGGVDKLLLDTYGAAERLLRSQCAAGACRGITRDPVGDVRALDARLAATPLRGAVADGGGRRVPTALTTGGLASLLVAGDLNPHLQAALPAAVHSALAGDAAPILRLVRPAAGPRLRVGELSAGLNVATSCADTRLSYSLTTPIAARGAVIAAALAAAPAARLGPFTRAAVGRTSVDQECRGWPVGTVRGPVGGPFPQVPTLILGGGLDWRTPIENDREVAGRIPGAQVVVVPGTGHDEIDSDASGCVNRALRRFFADRRVGDPCARISNQVPPQPVAATALRQVAPAPGVPGVRGRVLAAAVATLDDVREALLEVQDAGLSDRRGGGLRGGTWRLMGATGVVLRRVVWVPGVRVSGHVASRLGRYRGTLRVRGPHGMGGTLHLDRRRGLSGRLGGRRVHLPARDVRGAVQRSLERLR